MITGRRKRKVEARMRSYSVNPHHEADSQSMLGELLFLALIVIGCIGGAILFIK